MIQSVALEPIADDHLPAVGPRGCSLATSAPREVAIVKTVTALVTAPQSHALSRPCHHEVSSMWATAAVADVLPEFLDRGLQLGGGLPLQPGDHPDGDRQAEQVEGQLADRSLAQAIAPGQDAEDRPEPWPERPGGHARRQGRTGGGAAPGALQAVESILVHHGEDRRHFGDLVPDRLGVIAVRGHRRTSDIRAACTR